MILTHTSTYQLQVVPDHTCTYHWQYIPDSDCRADWRRDVGWLSRLGGPIQENRVRPSRTHRLGLSAAKCGGGGGGGWSARSDRPAGCRPAALTASGPNRPATSRPRRPPGHAGKDARKPLASPQGLGAFLGPNLKVPAAESSREAEAPFRLQAMGIGPRGKARPRLPRSASTPGGHHSEAGSGSESPAGGLRPRRVRRPGGPAARRGRASLSLTESASALRLPVTVAAVTLTARPGGALRLQVPVPGQSLSLRGSDSEPLNVSASECRPGPASESLAAQCIH
jgi:hypothetical protein